MRTSILLALVALSQAAQAGGLPKAGVFGLSVPPSVSSMEFTLKRTISDRAMLLVAPEFYAYRNDTDETRTSSSGEEVTVSRQREVARLAVYGGLREYLSISDINWFWQPELGIIVRRDYYDFASSSSSISSSDYDAYTIGVGARLMIGAEHFVTRSFSIEGRIGFGAEYVGNSLQQDYKERYIDARILSGVRVTWYMR